MSTGREGPKDAGSASPEGRARRTDLRALVSRIEGLIADLEALQGEEGDGGEPRVELWRDEESLYLEAELARGVEGHVDICLFESKLFIRIET